MAAPDTTPPTLTGLTLPTTIDVTSGDRTASFTARASDVGTGIDHVTLLFDHSVATPGGSLFGLTFSDTVDSFADGQSISTPVFTASTAAGTYNVTGAYVYDKAGNTHFYTTSDLTGLGIATSFQVVNNASADTSPPTLTGLTLPTTIDVTGGDRTASFTTRATDVGTGVDHITLLLDHSIATSSESLSSLTFSDAVDSFTDGVSVYAPTLSASTAAGTYNVTGAYVYDKAGNYTSYSASQLAAMGITTSFNVASNISADNTPPTLNGLVLPSTIDITGGDKVVSFTARASDVGTGVDHVALLLDHSFATPNGSLSGLTFSDAKDSFGDGASVSTLILGASTAAGTYNVTGAYVYDKAGNYTYYSNSQLTGLGVATSFQVIDHNVAVTASVIAPASVVEGNDAGIALSLALKNVTIASGTVTMAFLPDQSTVTDGVDVSVPAYSGSYSVVQSSSGTYTLALPSIGIIDDLVAERMETLAVRITASGQVFDSGTDSTIVRISLIDNDLAGTTGDDVLTGTNANERFTGGRGNDRIDGGGGIDTAVFGSDLAQSTVSFAADGSVVVTGSDGRDTLLNIEKIQFSNGALDVAASAPVGALYDTWGGRDASAAELSYWTGQIASGAIGLAGIKAAILGDPLGIGHTNDVVTALYQNLGGRAPSAAELATWRAQIAGGASFDTVRSAILADPLGAAAKAVAGLYADYMGRTASDAELGVWVPQVKAGLALASVRTTILDDAAGRGHTDAVVTQLYQTYGGRAPSAAELQAWEGNVRAGGTFADVRHAILADPLGTNHTGDVVTGLYQTYGGRAPSAAELQTWQASVLAGASYDDVRHAILADPLGINHTNTAVTQLYQAEFGRAASTGDLAAWQGLIGAGATFDTLLDTLIADRGSDATGTQRLTGTTGVDTFTIGHGHETAVTGFDPLQDSLTLSRTDVASGNPLDAAHARQVYSLDGTPDVLMTLDDGHHVLLAHTLLANLSANSIHLA